MAIINKDKATELILKQGFSGSYQSEQVTFCLNAPILNLPIPQKKNA